MAQYDIDLRDYWRIIKKRKTIIIFSMITLMLFSFIFGKYKKSRIIDYYSSSSTIRIDKVLTNSEVIMSNYGFSNTDDIATEVRTITSFPIMAGVAIRSNILPDSLKDMPETLRNEIIQSDPYLMSKVNDLADHFTPERYQYTNIVNVQAVADDPIIAYHLAQHIVEIYKDFKKKNANQRIINTIEFIEDEIKQIDLDMGNNLKKIQAYSSKNDSLIPFFAGNSISNDMVGVTRKLDDLEFKKNSTEQMIARLEQDGVIDDSVLSNAFAEEEGGIFKEKYSELLRFYSQREDLFQYFTDEYSEIKIINTKIENSKQLLLNQLKSNLKALDMQKKSYNDTYENLRARHQIYVAKSDSLQRLIDAKGFLQERYSNYNDQLHSIKIKKSENVDEVSIIKPAVPNYTPINTSTSVATISFIGLFLGMIIGLVASFVFEALDTSIGTIEDVEEYLGVSVVGLIPQIEFNDIKFKKSSLQRGIDKEKEISEDLARLVIHYAPKSVLAESYRSLRTNIQFISFEQEAKVLLFTSSSPREGKTTTIVNLALTMAQSGNKVLLVDADLRKPALYRIFGLEKGHGLSEIILSKRHWRECVKTVTDIITGELGMSDIILMPGIDNLHIITCGTIPPNPSELLNSDNMDDFIDSIKKEYDMVLFDCSPVLPATDSAVLGRKVDGIVLVYAVGNVSRSSLKRAKAHMDNVKARVIGIVLNGMRSDVSADFLDYKYNENYYTYEGEDIKVQKKSVGKIRGKMEKFISRFK